MTDKNYWDIFLESWLNYGGYVVRSLYQLEWNNYLYWLMGISGFFFILEWLMPWRKNQPLLKQDFWLDVFYMFFNFFLFSLLGYYAVSMVVVAGFNDILAYFGITNLVALKINAWPTWGQLLTLFVVRDFIQWNIHRLLHRVPFLWEFHKLHHSAKHLRFATHLRFHWMETIIYRTLEYIPLAMIGFGIQDFFLVHIFATAIGHFNHSNIKIPLGPLKFLFNNPQMHTWHHVKYLPQAHKHGVNYGISLSIWDYLFGSAYMPHDGQKEELGYAGDEQMPGTFKEQLVYPLLKSGRKS